MLDRARELIFSLVAMVFITVIYLVIMTTSRGVPLASGLYGHAMGIVGFLMMAMTETLYSLRKRWKAARWGRMAEWLEFHIFTGLVGPYLVLLHSAWTFNGLAGVVVLLMVMIVASGIVGRYFYTAVPRTLDGAEVSLDTLEAQVRGLGEQIEAAYARLHGDAPQAPGAGMPGAGMPGAETPGTETPEVELAAEKPAAGEADGYGELAVLAAEAQPGSAPAPAPVRAAGKRAGGIGPALQSARARWDAWRRSMTPTDDEKRLAQAERKLEKLIGEQKRLKRQIGSLETARRILAVWHAVHIPLGLAMFVLSFVHIGAAIYYSVLLR